jgi:hypothetical protein
MTSETPSAPERDVHVHLPDGRQVAVLGWSFGPEHLCECAHPEVGPCLRCDGEIR